MLEKLAYQKDIQKIHFQNNKHQQLVQLYIRRLLKEKNIKITLETWDIIEMLKQSQYVLIYQKEILMKELKNGQKKQINI
ncbi:unnamed protein product [Paramecium sonneborni]|uniref:Uncharacterized protein n=1 Tax=Paramecium sonneborni TaxID=65129 RepID=A0A8S1QRG0_9CILI|nr:unnamed protein product [Paramecium sonneborni]